jgi:hypothetical protein
MNSRWRIRILIAATAMFAYSYFYQAGGWNQNSRFDLTRSVVERGALDITPLAANTGDLARKDGKVYCDKAPAVSILATLGYAPWRWVAGTPAPTNKPASDRAAYVSTLVASALPSAIFLALLFEWLAVLLASPRLRLLLVAGYGLGTLAWPYSTLMYGHQLLAICGASAFLLLLNLKTGSAIADSPGGRVTSVGNRTRLFSVGALLGVAAATEYTAPLVGIALMIYTLSWLRDIRALGWIVLGMIVPGALLAWYHHAAFGGPITLAYQFSTQSHRSQGFFMGLGSPDPTAIFNILLGPYRGLFFSSPWLVAMFASAPLLANSRFRAELRTCWVIFTMFVWMNSSLVDWQGGWACGARYLIPAIPFAVIAIAAWLGSRQLSGSRTHRRFLAGASLLVVISAGLMLLATSVKPEIPTHIRNPWTQYLWPKFSHGLLSLSTQSIDSIGEGKTAVAWNIGGALGLPGLAQLIPLLLVLLAAGWALMRLTRTDSTESFSG